SLPQMISTGVGQSSHVRVVSPDRVLQMMSDLGIPTRSELDPATLKNLAKLSQARFVVSGQYSQAGSRIQLAAGIQDLETGRATPSSAQAPDVNGLPAAIDTLSQSIREGLALSPKLLEELKAQSWKPSTKSFSALGSFNKGLALTRQGNHQLALEQ